MKTIFLTIFEGVESKNILRTGIVARLLASDPSTRIVLFVKNKERAEYYKKEFNDPRILYEIADPPPSRGLDKFFSNIKFYFLRTPTTKLRAEIVAQDRWPFYYHLKLFLHWVLARRIFVKIFRFLDLILIENDYFDKYFDRYHPDLIFLANLFDDLETNFLRSAKKYRVKSVGFMNTWDRITNRAILRVLPDEFIVWNNMLKKAMITTNYVDEKEIYVSGIPQYDRYFQAPDISREKFLAGLGVNPDNRLIVYSPLGNKFSNSDWDIIDLLYKLNKTGKFGDKVSILVRFSPNDFINQEELSKRPDMLYQSPGVRFSDKRTIDWDMTTEELEELKDTLFHMDLMICYASSISVDSAVFDKPVINIDFEVKPIIKLEKSATTWRRLGHYTQALATGGIRLVNSEGELVEWVNKYLLNPNLDREGRERLVRQQLEFIDGKSAERVVEYICRSVAVS